MSKKISKVTVVGAGLMGNGIAQIFASQGAIVTVYDLNPAKSMVHETIEANLKLLCQHGKFAEAEIAPTLARINATSYLAASVKDTQLVIESVAENLELKQKLFAELDQLAPPDAILASNTSAISITEIARDVVNKGRVVGTHFWNPPYLIPLVEVVRTIYTRNEIFEATCDVLTAYGKRAVRVNKDVPGFLVNRLQHALWREALYLVEQGIADAKTVDEGIRFGFGLRLPQLGPLENADMVGTDLTLAIHTYMFPHLNNATEPSPLLKELVASGKLGFKSGEGFRKWTEEEIKQSRTQLINYLINVV